MKTMRAGIRPASTSAIASLTSANDRVSRMTRLFPAACSSKTSRRSTRGPDDRADNGDAVENGLEDGELDVVLRRQGDEDERSSAAQRAVRLLERGRADCQRDRLVGSTQPLDELGRILLRGVDRELRTELLGRDRASRRRRRPRSPCSTRHAPAGGGVSRHGTQDAVRHQAAGRAARRAGPAESSRNAPW